MVVSAQVDASKAGVEVLQAGGNAIDAAVATGFALAVTYPGAGNVGGGGFMVIRFADGTSTSIDYRETAPAAASRDMYLDENGDFVPALSQRGYLASGVPGSVDGLLMAHQKYGKLSLKKVMAPSLRLAKKGFVLSRRAALTLNAYNETFSAYESTARYFTKGTTEVGYVEGERFKQKDLYKVLKRIRKDGRDGFYSGKTADLIVAEMQRGGGIITHSDLESYRAIERRPIIGSYRGHKVYSMPPASSGGIALVQLLNAVEPLPVSEMGFNSSATIHAMGESMRRVYADRAEWLGDSDYFEVPVEGLINKDYMRMRMQDFDPDRADSSAAVTFGNPFANESTETTHYSVVDSEGNAVSVTTTINSGFGSKVVVDGAGFFMNNEMDDFSAKPGVPNQFGLLGNEANAIEPGKRMLSAMTPTIVEDEKGRLKMVIGTPGGSTIITTVFQVILNVIDHDMDIAAAVSAPRVHHQWQPDVLFYENMGLAADVVDNLMARGWNVDERSGTSGRADGIVVSYENADSFVDDAGLDEISYRDLEPILFGGADPRGEDIAIGY
ncbi:MAG: gamma-glutamyltransferase [Rhodothermales bacterium]|nr:gamma-glutamyltransferase [Rhodothermales bacterium]